MYRKESEIGLLCSTVNTRNLSLFVPSTPMNQAALYADLATTVPVLLDQELFGKE